MAYPIHLYADSRHPTDPLRCQASIMGSYRTRQCSREPVSLGRVEYNFSQSRQGGLCSQHLRASNVTDLGREALRQHLGCLDDVCHA